MTNQEIQTEALSRARNGNSLINLPTIFQGFMEKGIPQHDIVPRVNVLTFHAWKAVGRRVKKGEHGVKVITWIDTKKEVDNGDGTKETKHSKRPWSSTVFHISQTQEL